MPKNRKVLIQDLGLMGYTKAWDYQTALFDSVVKAKIENASEIQSGAFSSSNFLLFVEHPPVYTLGKSGKDEHLLIQEEMLKQEGAEFVRTNRGGDITFHGPGQIVVYPILDLENFFTDIHKYMRTLEEAVILTCADFGVEASRVKGLTGVWVEDSRKICAMGVRTSRWVSMHGLALNVNTDLHFFNHIVPCGIENKAVTSLAKELRKPLDIVKVKTYLKQHLIDLFEIEPIY